MREGMDNPDLTDVQQEDSFTELPTALPKVKSFDPELLPSVLSVRALHVSRNKQSPIDFAAVSFLVAASSVAARYHCIQPKERDSWSVVPNLWGAMIGRPATKKSPTADDCMSPLGLIR